MYIGWEYMILEESSNKSSKTIHGGHGPSNRSCVVHTSEWEHSYETIGCGLFFFIGDVRTPV